MIIIGIAIVSFIVFIFALILYKSYVSGFQDKEEKINRIANHLGKNLTYKKLKRRCPECTNVDYYKAKKFI